MTTKELTQLAEEYRQANQYDEGIEDSYQAGFLKALELVGEHAGSIYKAPYQPHALNDMDFGYNEGIQEVLQPFQDLLP